LGQEQATALAVKLQEYTFDQIVCSPLQRALETVAPFLIATRDMAEVWPELAEACWQEEPQPPAETWLRAPTSLPAPISRLFRFRNDEMVTPVDPETYGQGLCRVHVVADRLRDMANDGSCGSLLVVAHGYLIRELLNILLQPETREEYPHDNCGISLLAYDDGWRLEYLNRTSG
jgi:broad specificity phosphatase PhoE